MNFYQVKVQITRNGKTKPEIYVSKASGFDLAGYEVLTNLLGFDPDVKVTDVNLKKYVNVFTTEDQTGPYYDVQIEFEDVDGKTVKELYLQQSYSTKQAEEALAINVSGGYEVKSTKETNIVDYFIETINESE